MNLKRKTPECSSHPGEYFALLLFPEDNAVFVGAFDDCQGLEVDACFTQLCAAGLEALFNGNAYADEFGACAADYLAQAAESLAVGQEVIHDEYLVGGLEPLCGYQQGNFLFISIGVDLAPEQAALLSLLAFLA